VHAVTGRVYSPDAGLARLVERWQSPASLPLLSFQNPVPMHRAGVSGDAFAELAEVCVIRDLPDRGPGTPAIEDAAGPLLDYHGAPSATYFRLRRDCPLPPLFLRGFQFSLALLRRHGLFTAHFAVSGEGWRAAPMAREAKQFVDLVPDDTATVAQFVQVVVAVAVGGVQAVRLQD